MYGQRGVQFVEGCNAMDLMRQRNQTGSRRLRSPSEWLIWCSGFRNKVSDANAFAVLLAMANAARTANEDTESQ
jgi:hypothetical protein